MNLFKIEPQRVKHSNLMGNELASNTKRSLAIKQFNTFRLLTNIIFLSEICNANGNELDPKIINYSISIVT